MQSAPTHLDQDYLDWIVELSKRYRQSQIKAAVSVNSQMLRFYWSVGQDISQRSLENKYGSRFYECVGLDLRNALNLKKGFSATTLKYTKYFYELYAPLFANCQQDVDDSQTDSNRLHGADDFEMLFCIPWTHHQYIINKVGGNAEKALFFVRKSLENNWGRGVLLNFLDTDLYESQGNAQTNFKLIPIGQLL